LAILSREPVHPAALTSAWAISFKDQSCRARCIPNPQPTLPRQQRCRGASLAKSAWCTAEGPEPSSLKHHWATRFPRLQNALTTQKHISPLVLLEKEPVNTGFSELAERLGRPSSRPRRTGAFLHQPRPRETTRSNFVSKSSSEKGGPCILRNPLARTRRHRGLPTTAQAAEGRFPPPGQLLNSVNNCRRTHCPWVPKGKSPRGEDLAVKTSHPQ